MNLSKFIYNGDYFNLSNTFKYCVSLTSITFPNVSWDVEDFSSTFYGCSSLTTLDLSNWVGNYYEDTGNYTFTDC